MIQVPAFQRCVILLAFMVTTTAAAAMWRVGPSGDFQKPCEAFRSAQVVSGDTIEIAADGNYAGDVCAIDKSNLIIRGTGGRPKLDAAGVRLAHDKGIWVIYGNDIVVENIEFTNAMISDLLGANGAGIRQEGKNLTVRASYFHGNQNGILVTGNSTGGADSEVLIEHSEFAYNGRCDGSQGCAHNVYVNRAARLIFRHNYSHHAKDGHLLKSRALENQVLYNRMTSEWTSTSYELDLPNGGKAYVIGNLFQQPENAGNSALLAYGMEGTRGVDELYVVNNTFVSSRSAGTVFVTVGAGVSTPVLLQNNIFHNASAGPASIVTQASARQVTNCTEDPLFIDGANFNYRLRPESPCINRGTAPGLVNGVDLTPIYQYVHVASREQRVIGGAIDVGAYEAMEAVAGCPLGQYRAEYFNNTTLSGTPVLVRCEAAPINSNWGWDSPGNGVPSDAFSVRWTGRFNFTAGAYTFSSTGDDGVRVYVDGTRIIDAWRDQSATEYHASSTLTAGEHTVVMEYFENTGLAVAKLQWRAEACPLGQYQAEYFNNTTLSGMPVLVRCEAAPINYNWGWDSPGNGVPSDAFSVRWTGRFNFTAGAYTFSSTGDDGVRVYVDGTRIIDAWRDQSATEYRASSTLTAGEHTVVMEYFENTGLAVAKLLW